MMRVRFKRFWKRLGRGCLFLWGWLLWIVGLGLSILGLAGVSDDFAKWQEFIDYTTSDPRIRAVMEQALGFASDLDMWWVRGLLIALGITILAWAWRPFGRFRHRLGFRWRRLVADKVWIARPAALKVIKDSQWGRLKEPNVVKRVGVFDSLASSFVKEEVKYGLSDVQKALMKYEIFLDRTLDSFCEANPKGCRTIDGRQEIDEVTLMLFIDKALDDEIGTEFGEVPSFTVT